MQLLLKTIALLLACAHVTAALAQEKPNETTTIEPKLTYRASSMQKK